MKPLQADYPRRMRIVEVGPWDGLQAEPTSVSIVDTCQIIERLSQSSLPVIHFHDTRGQALTNTLACLELGVATVDAAIGGLGGCPYARGAAGNQAPEDLVYMLHGMGIETSVDLHRLIAAGRFVNQIPARENRSRVGQAGIDPNGAFVQ